MSRRRQHIITAILLIAVYFVWRSFVTGPQTFTPGGLVGYVAIGLGVGFLCAAVATLIDKVLP